MKKLNYLLVILFTASLFVGCKSNETDTTADPNDPGTNPTPGITVTQKQNALLIEPTATWCGPCGTYGHPATDGVLTGNDNVVGIYAHLKAPASDIGNQVGQDLAVMVGAANATGTSYSIPKIAVGDNITGAYTDINYTKGILNGWINTIIAGTSKVNSKIETSITGSDLKIKTHTKFFENGLPNNQYKISIIVNEDNIPNRQNQSSGGYINIVHNNVARISAGITSGNDLHDAAAIPTLGKIIDKEFTVALNPGWKREDLRVIAIIWRQEGGKLYFVNVDKLDLN